MLDWLVDPITNDIDFSSGDLALVAGVEEIKQANRIYLQLFQGEWFDDEDAGIPYMQHIFQKAVSYSDTGSRGISDLTVEAVMRRKILEVDGNESILQYQQDLTKATRELDVSYTVKSEEGEIPVSEVLTWLTV